jgi:hypothetical protein
MAHLPHAPRSLGAHLDDGVPKSVQRALSVQQRDVWDAVFVFVLPICQVHP